MTDAQSNQLDMYGVVDGLYTVHQAVIDTVPARATAFTTFRSNLAAIRINVANQSLVTAGITADKALARTDLDQISFIIFSICRAWAIANKDNTNAQEFNFSRSKISKVKDDTIIPFLTHRLTIITDNAAALADYGITSAIITSWQDSMNALAAINSSPRSAIVSRSVSTARLKTLFEANQKLLRDIIDPLMMLLQLTDLELYQQYQSSRIVIDRHGPGNSTTMTIEGLITDAHTGAPLPKVTVILGSGPEALEVQTDDQGRFILEFESPQKEVETTLTAYFPSYAKDIRNITIRPAESSEENFQLQPVPPVP